MQALRVLVSFLCARDLIVFLALALPAGFLSARRLRVPFPLLLSGIFGFLLLRIAAPWAAGTGFSGAGVYFCAMGFSCATSAAVVFVAMLFSAGAVGKTEIAFSVFCALFLFCPWNLVSLAFAALSAVIFYLARVFVESRSVGKGVFRPVFSVPFVPFMAVGAVIAKLMERI